MPKEKLLLVGAGGFGRVVSEQARLAYNCAFVDDGFEIGTEICGITVIGHLSDLESLRSEYGKLVIAIGNSTLRAQIYQKALMNDYSFPNIICSSAYISPYAKIGWGCVILNNAVIQNGAIVGNGVLVNPGVEIHHDSFVNDFSLIYTNSIVRTGAKVGKCVRIGSNVTICNNAVVPDSADIPDCTAVH